MASSKNSWVEELELMRAFGILAVILIHCTGRATRLPSDFQLYWFFSVLNQILQFAVPLFLFISAIALAYKYSCNESYSLKRYYFRRTIQNILPYISWTCIYLYYRFGILHENTNLLFSEDILKINEFYSNIIFWGKGYYHLYFICIIIQFYFLFPLIRLVYKYIVFGWNRVFRDLRRNKKLKGLFNINTFIVFIVVLYWLQYAFIVLNQKYIYFGFKFNWFGEPYYFFGFKSTGSLVFSYIIMIGMGLWIGFNYFKWAKIYKWLRIIVYPGVIISGWYYVWASITPDIFNGLQSEHIAMLRSTYVLFVCLLLYDFCVFLKSKKGVMLGVLKSIGRYSFGIFLIHPMLLDIFTSNEFFNQNENVFWVYLLSRFILFIFVLQLSWLIVYLLNKLSLTSTLLFGKRKYKPEPPLLLAEKTS